MKAIAIGVMCVAWAWDAGAARAIPDDVPGPEGVLVDDGGWDAAPPDAELEARARAAAEYSKRHAGLALLVVRDDAVVFEDAENGYDLQRAHHVWSGTKTFTCPLALAAEADGRFGLDTAIGTQLALDARRARITVRDLLSLTSGLSESPLLTTDLLKAHPAIADKEAWTLSEITAVFAPGERFRYAASSFAMFSAFARKALGEDPIAYLERRVLAPIGLKQAGWVRDGAGHAWFSFGAYTTARSWARLGMLLRDDGVFRGTRVLPAGALAACFRGTVAMPAYGLGMWLNKDVVGDARLRIPTALQGRFARKGPVLLPGGPSDLVAAAGYADNRLYVIPSLRLVVVRLGTGHPRFEDAALLGRLLGVGTR